MNQPQFQPLTEDELRRRKARSRALALTLAALCIFFFVVTVFKLGPGVLVRPL
ncbi:MAG: hypothetical protein ACRCXM_11595 [Beijerinckiaceae bacterium]